MSVGRVVIITVVLTVSGLAGLALAAIAQPSSDAAPSTNALPWTDPATEDLIQVDIIKLSSWAVTYDVTCAEPARAVVQMEYGGYTTYVRPFDCSPEPQRRTSGVSMENFAYGDDVELTPKVQLLVGSTEMNFELEPVTAPMVEAEAPRIEFDRENLRVDQVRQTVVDGELVMFVDAVCDTPIPEANAEVFVLQYPDGEKVLARGRSEPARCDGATTFEIPVRAIWGVLGAGSAQVSGHVSATNAKWPTSVFNDREDAQLLVGMELPTTPFTVPPWVSEPPIPVMP